MQSINVCTDPIRAIKFITGKGWLAVGADDLKLRVYNYHTGEKVQEWEAHNDYIRGISIQGNLILSCSDDQMIKSWDISKGFKVRFYPLFIPNLARKHV